jgi:hypothetical protein
MSDDDAEIRRSPKKHKRSVLPSDAAKTIIKNKEQKNNKNVHPKTRAEKASKEVGKHNNDPHKTKASNALGITNESEESDGDNFEPDTDKKAKSAGEALLDAYAKSGGGIKLRNESRKRPEYILEAKKKQDAEDWRLAQEKTTRSTSPTLSEGTPDYTVERGRTKQATSSTSSAAKKKTLTERGIQPTSGQPLHRTGSNSSDNASSANKSPPFDYDPSPRRAVGGGRKSLPYAALPDGPTHYGPGNKTEERMLKARTVEAINDIQPRPDGSTPVPFMYWRTHLPHLCAAQLITRYNDLVKYANKHYHGVPQMAHTHAATIRNTANNERSVQVTAIQKIWLTESSKFAMAFPFVPQNDLTEDTPSVDLMKLSTNMELSGLESVAQLRTLIRSSEMYKNAAVFTIFCQGLESGLLKQSMKLPPTPLAKLITIAHEAHFRAELWLHLGKATFRHLTTNDVIRYRKENFDEFCDIVAKDREDNEADASSRRLGRDLNGDGDAAEFSNVPINPKFY